MGSAQTANGRDECRRVIAAGLHVERERERETMGTVADDNPLISRLC